MKPKEYQIITASSPGKLEGLVNDALAKGWLIAGGLCVCPNWAKVNPESVYLFAQAMTKE